MILLVSQIQPGPNMSRAPSGLLEFICNTLSPITLYDQSEQIRFSNDALLLVYGVTKGAKCPSKVTNANIKSKILIGPDAHYLNHMSFVYSLRLPYFFCNLIRRSLLHFQRASLAHFDTVIVVGRKDYDLIKESGFSGNLYYLPHPYLTSVKAQTPILPTGQIKKVILIGKSSGLPVGFRKFRPGKLLQLYELLAAQGILLEVFQSTNLDISKLPSSAIKIQAEVLEVDYFSDSVVVNLATIGAGTANRMLSALHDGAVLSSNEFGFRNIDTSRWSHRIIQNPYNIFTQAWMGTLMAGINDYNQKNHHFMDDAVQIQNENLDIAKYLLEILEDLPNAS